MAVKKATKKTLKTAKKKRSAAKVKKGYAYEYRSLNSKMSPSEVFGVAIKSEIEAAEVYSSWQVFYIVRCHVEFTMTRCDSP